jgi:5'-AMP-activated protein kinase catalytic alpha subunit
VKRAQHILTGVTVAVKILNRGKVKALKMDNKIRREIQILQLFRHPHIIRMYDVIETSTDVFMFLEFVSGGELFDLIVQKGKLEEPEARKYFQQVISGIE